jgi:hypothetical protein
MRLLRGSFVRAQIKITGGDQPVVAQDALDMPNGAAIKEDCYGENGEKIKGKSISHRFQKGFREGIRIWLPKATQLG